jgi:hypothetical protein
MAAMGIFLSSSARCADMDHGLWDRILKKHVTDGLVDYRKIKADPDELLQYLEKIANLKELDKLPPPAQIAFYINAYNAVTVKRIIDHYPPKKESIFNFLNPEVSIKNISGVWDGIKDKVAGEMLTLDDIEHNILRKEYKEPRIHMALVCASMSCPELHDRAFTGEKLDGQLNKVTRRFLTDKSRNRICPGCDEVLLSKIFSWYGDDFLGKYPPDKELKKRHGEKIASVITFVASHLPPKAKKYLLDGNYDVGFLDYDWSLNEPKQAE